MKLQISSFICLGGQNLGSVLPEYLSRFHLSFCFFFFGFFNPFVVSWSVS